MEFGRDPNIYTDDSMRHIRNHYIMNLPQEEFDRLYNQIIPDIDTSKYVGD